MPYSSLDELPENTKSLPKHAKEIFLASFNSAIEQGNSEESAFKIAWSVVGKSYEKVGDKWQAISNLDSAIINSENEITNADHDVVLQRLNQKIHYKEYGDVFYPTQLFQEMGNKWDGIPLIFGRDHPDFTLFTQNPELALKQIGGCIVGKVTNPRVDATGTPRFMGNFQIDNPVIENLIQSGKIAHSTGFRFKVDDKNTLTSMSPHHVLLFTQDKDNNPKDAGAMILNKEDELEIENATGCKNPDLPASAYAWVEDPDMKTKWHLPIRGMDGKLKPECVRAALAAIGGARSGKPMKVPASVVSELKAHAKALNIEIKNMETDMANKDYTKEDMDAMLDFMKANPGMMDKSMMDKMYAAMDGANQKEYMKGMLKDLQSHPEMMDDEMKTMMKGMKNKQETKDTMGKEDELTKQLEISNKEKETLTGQVEGLKKEIANKDAQLKVFEQEKTERIKATTESRWQTIVNALPKGIRDDKDRSAKLRTEFETDPQGFNVTLLEIKNTEAKIVQGLPGEEGNAIVNTEGEDRTQHVGSWNPRTQKWEEA